VFLENERVVFGDVFFACLREVGNSAAGGWGLDQRMVKVKGVEWNHVVVVKEPEKHGMATLVRCAHCEKEFQGNAMRIRAHLVGNKRAAGVSGCPSCPDKARQELRLVDEAKSLTQRKREARSRRSSTRTTMSSSAPSDHSPDNSGQPVDLMPSLQKGEKMAVEHAFKSMVFQAGGLPLNFVNLSPCKAVCAFSCFLCLRHVHCCFISEISWQIVCNAMNFMS